MYFFVFPAYVFERGDKNLKFQRWKYQETKQNAPRFAFLFLRLDRASVARNFIRTFEKRAVNVLIIVKVKIGYQKTAAKRIRMRQFRAKWRNDRKLNYYFLLLPSVFYRGVGYQIFSRYPTFRYFNYGKKDFKYIGGRVAKDFIQFMENPREGPPPPPSEPEWKDMPSHVTHLTDDTFEEFVKTHHSVLVMFYAPCKYVCVLLDFLDMKIM